MRSLELVWNFDLPRNKLTQVNFVSPQVRVLTRVKLLKCSLLKASGPCSHRGEGGLYATDTGIKHTRKYSLCSQSGHVNKQQSITDVYYCK